MKTTKQLARELGLLRKRSLATSPTEADRQKRQKTSQQFAYLVVIDFESTCWENDKTKTQEIIEFPAVLLNTRTGEIEREFHFYLQPQEHPTLSTFCRQLTGITQEQVDHGIPLSLCLRKFSHWLHQLSREKKVWMAGDPALAVGDQSLQASSLNLAAFVTWSDWDLGVCLQYELKRKQIAKAPCFCQWVDLRATYTKFYGRKPKGLNGALQDVGIEFEGREHSGLHDARNTAKLAWRMIRDGCIMKITKTLTSERNPGSCRPQQTNPGRKTAAHTPKQKTPGKKLANMSPAKRTPEKMSLPNTTPRNKAQVKMINSAGSNKQVRTPGKITSSKVTPTKASRIVKGSDKQLKTPQKCPPVVCYEDPTAPEEQNQPTPTKRRMCLNPPALPSVSAGLQIRNTNISESKEAIVKILKVKGDNFVYTPEKNAQAPVESITPSKLMSSSPLARRTSPRLKARKQDTSAGDSYPRSKTMKEPTAKDGQMCAATVGTHLGPEATVAGVNSALTSNTTFSSSSASTKQQSPPSTCRMADGVPAASVSVNPRLVENTPLTCKTLRGQQCQPGQTSTPLFVKTLDASCFRTPSPYQNSAGFGSFRTPLHPPPSSASKMKATPPLCRCGRRAKRRMVQNPGPNMGRWFFSCGKGTRSPSNENSTKSGCSFFQWELCQRTATAISQCTPVNRGDYRSYSSVSRPFTPVLNAPASLSYRKTYTVTPAGATRSSIR